MPNHEDFKRRLEWLVQTRGDGCISLFCEKMRIDRHIYYNWSKGDSMPTGKILARMARRGVDLNWLLTGKTLRLKRKDGQE